MRTAAIVQLQLHFLILLLGIIRGLQDFQDSRYNVDFIYHGNHNAPRAAVSCGTSHASAELLLTIYANTCYFTHVNNSTRAAFENCHRAYLENEVRDKIDWGDEDVLKPSTMDEMRNIYHDVLADFRCKGKNIVRLNVTFGEDYIKQCTSAEEPVGK